MVKIIGILAIVLVYLCEINAEISNHESGKAVTKKIFAANTLAEAQPRAKLTTGFPEEVGDLLKNLTIKVVEALKIDLEKLAVERHKTKTIDIDKDIKKDSESNKPERKKKKHDHSAKLTSNDTGEMDFANKKHQKDKKGNIEKNKTDKETKHKNHKDKHNKPAEKSMNYDNDTSIQNTTRLWYRGMSEERLNDDIKKKNQTLDKDKKKHSIKNKQINKSKDDIRMAKGVGKSLPSSKDLKVQPGINKKKVLTLTSTLNNDIKKKKQTVEKDKKKHRIKSKQIDKSKDAIRVAKVIRESLHSSKDLKLQPGINTKKVHISTSTPKPQPKPVRVGVVDRTLYKSKAALRAPKNYNGEKIRNLRHGPGGREGDGEEAEEGEGDDGEEYEEEKGGDGDDGKHEKDKYPSQLSPYAIWVQMLGLMKEFPKVNATVTKFARTVEYNDIVLITVTDKKGSERYSRAKDSKYIDDAPEKKIIFIVHGLTVMGMKNMPSLTHMSQLKLLFSYYFKFIDKFDFYIMPLANPDGYSLTHSFSRPIWNKNVSPQSVCPGVSVDRNFDIGWNATKEISSCSQLYPGATPFSEVESKAIRDVFHYFSHKILAYIHVHAGTYDEKVFKGDAILYPRGYTETQSDDDKYIDLKGEIDEAMKNASFRVISVSMDTLANWYGVISGSSVDYAAAVFGIPYALEFVMQIYDTDTLNSHALTQIWSRLIETTLSHLWKSVHHASEERKSH